MPRAMSPLLFLLALVAVVSFVCSPSSNSRGPRRTWYR
jgi:hypothetical protein